MHYRLYYFFQQHYSLDSFVQYVGRLPVSPLSSKAKTVQAHYIAFRKIDEEWFRFDDAVVHRVELQQRYSVSLIVYRQARVPAYFNHVDLDNVPMLQRSRILNRRNSESQKKETETKDAENVEQPTPSNFASKLRHRPSLITPDSEDVGRKKRSAVELKPEKPTRVQPSRRNKDLTVYYALESESSDYDTPDDAKNADSDYIPQEAPGQYMCRINVSNICITSRLLTLTLNISPEYFNCISFI